MLEAFFTPVQKSITKQYAKASGVLGSELKIYSNKFPSTKNIDIAIIGLGTNADLCRKELYALHYHFSGVEVADFGNLNHDGSDKNFTVANLAGIGRLDDGIDRLLNLLVFQW